MSVVKEFARVRRVHESAPAHTLRTANGPCARRPAKSGPARRASKLVSLGQSQPKKPVLNGRYRDNGRNGRVLLGARSGNAFDRADRSSAFRRRRKTALRPRSPSRPASILLEVEKRTFRHSKSRRRIWRPW